MAVVDVRIASVYYLWPQRVAFGNFTTHQISSLALRFALSAHATSTLASSVSNVLTFSQIVEFHSITIVSYA